MTTKVGKAYVYYQSIDPAKVVVVQALCNAMMAFPHLRLGQLICNARNMNLIRRRYCGDEFYISDAHLGVALNEYVEKCAKAEAENNDHDG
jgi:hypothetical protein